jgi:hypothetical protein
MSGTFGKNFFQPDYEWGFMTVRITFIHTRARIPLIPPSRRFRPLKSTAMTRYSIGHGTILQCTRFFVLYMSD